MSGVSAITGELGKVTVDTQLVARITQWSVSSVVSESAWGDSDSNGYTNRKKARKDATGSIAGKYDIDDQVLLIFKPGDIVTIALWETASRYWYFTSALIQNFKLTFDNDSKEVVGWTADFGADGIFYSPGQAGAPAAALP